ncbi:MAG TPA: tetratricopeptide repeat protein [Bacilli bacterium]
MFRQLFATMFEALEQIERQYAEAKGGTRKELEQQLAVLKAMSDECMEQWLLFEEKMASFAELANLPQPQAKSKQNGGAASAMADPCTVDAEHLGLFIKAQGYFKLLMYDEAIRIFEKLVTESPDFLWARLYLALGYVHKGDYNEAFRHFRLLIPFADHPRMLAIAYNAMGCIQVCRANLADAREFFAKAQQSDPTYGIPGEHFQACRIDAEALKKTVEQPPHS